MSAPPRIAEADRELARRRRVLRDVTEPERGEGGEGSAAVPLPARPRGSAAALLVACRPRQWLKNLLVLAAPAAAGVLTHAAVAGRVAVALVSFCLLASSTYLVNDVRDREEDARHPRRRRRPIAAGELSPALALAAAGVLGSLGTALSFLVDPGLGAVALGYLALTFSYSLWLRSVAVADIAAVSGCFVLRAIAGGVAAGVPVSHWFVMVASFGALFLVAGKRYAELHREGAGSATRASLRMYSEGYLRMVMIIAASVTTAAYCLWAFQGRGHDGLIWYELTIAPFMLWLLRYALLIDAGAGEAPEELILRDRFLLAMSVLWVGVFACAVYVGS